MTVGANSERGEISGEPLPESVRVLESDVEIALEVGSRAE
jgi:hypothetical protein